MVGREKKVFKLHMQLLCDTSPYFSATFEGMFKEGKEQLLDLSEEDVAVFEQFQLWLYSGIIKPTAADDCMNQRVLVKLYVFGDKRGIPQLQNDAIDYLIDVIRDPGSFHVILIPWVYENTTATSPLRTLFVDMMVQWSRVSEGANWFESQFTANYPLEYILAVAKGLCGRLHNKPPKIDNFRSIRSNYYV